MNTHYLYRARRIWRNDMVPRRTVRHNMRAWVRALRLLGDKWVGLADDLRKEAK